MTNGDSAKIVERQGQKAWSQGVQMKRLGCGPSWRAHDFNLHGQVYEAKEEAEQYLESDKMASLSFLFSERLPADFVADFV